MHACTSGDSSSNLAMPPPEMPEKKKAAPATKTATVVNAGTLKLPSSATNGFGLASAAASAASFSSTCACCNSANDRAGVGHDCSSASVSRSVVPRRFEAAIPDPAVPRKCNAKEATSA